MKKCIIEFSTKNAAVITNDPETHPTPEFDVEVGAEFDDDDEDEPEEEAETVVIFTFIP